MLIIYGSVFRLTTGCTPRKRFESAKKFYVGRPFEFHLSNLRRNVTFENKNRFFFFISKFEIGPETDKTKPISGRVVHLAPKPSIIFFYRERTKNLPHRKKSKEPTLFLRFPFWKSPKRTKKFSKKSKKNKKKLEEPWKFIVLDKQKKKR